MIAEGDEGVEPSTAVLLSLGQGPQGPAIESRTGSQQSSVLETFLDGLDAGRSRAAESSNSPSHMVPRTEKFPSNRLDRFFGQEIPSIHLLISLQQRNLQRELPISSCVLD